MQKFLICVPTFLLLASGINYSNYRSYYDTIYKVQTIDFNILSSSLPTKLSLALINKDKPEIQRTINSNYGYFGIVVTNCLKIDKQCEEETIIAKSQPEKDGWKEKAVVGKLSNYQFDILRNPPPITAELNFKNSRDKEIAKPTGRINNGQIIGRVYYIRRDPPVGFVHSLIDWISHPFKAAQIFTHTQSVDLAQKEFEQFFDYGANKFYILTNVGAMFLGLFIGQLWKYNEERRLRLKQDVKHLKEELNTKTVQLQSITKKLKKKESLIQSQSIQASGDLEKLKATATDYQTKIESKDKEIVDIRKVLSEIQDRIIVYRQKNSDENTRILSDLAQQEQIATEKEANLNEQRDKFNLELGRLQTELDDKKEKILIIQDELLSTKNSLEEAKNKIESLILTQEKYSELLNSSQIDKNKILKLDTDLLVSKEELDKFIQGFDRDNEITELKNKITNLENEKIELSNNSQDLSKEINSLNKRIANLIDCQNQELKISSSDTEGINSQNISFSFEYYDDKHDKFNSEDRDPIYFLKLLERLKSLSSQLPQELIINPNGSLRCHVIDWDKTSEDSFGLLQKEYLAKNRYQFSISQSEHGRVHGFFINNVFYIVWLDPNHLLYP